MLTLGAWTHDLSPYVWRISGDFGIRWYGISYLAGFIAGYLMLKLMARKGWVRVPTAAVMDFILAAVLGTIIGGRLGYVLIYRLELLWEFRPTLPWWGVLDVAHGGMASHGGMIGMIIACVIFSRKLVRAGFKDATPLHLMDCLCLICPPGLFFGRIANFINGELLGATVADPGKPSPWWSVRFPQELRDEPLRYPHTQEQQDAISALVDSAGGSLDAVIDRIQHGDTTLRDSLGQYLYARHPSQIYQAIAEGIVLLLVLWWVWRKPRKPGVMVATFFITYGIGRIATEHWRLPDTHLAVQRWLGLSRGQWLSVVMVVAGCILLGVLRKSAAKPLGGWMTRSAPITPQSS